MNPGDSADCEDSDVVLPLLGLACAVVGVVVSSTTACWVERAADIGTSFVACSASVDGDLVVARPSLVADRVSVVEVRMSVVVFVVVLVVVATGLFLSRTRYGLIVRAGVYDEDKTATMGLNVERAFTLVFALGAAIAALGGVIYIYRALTPGLGSGIILQAFIVVIVGGLGSFKGSVLAALFIGIVWQFTAVYTSLPSGTVIFLVVLAVLLARPRGLFGEAEVDV